MRLECTIKYDNELVARQQNIAQIVRFTIPINFKSLEIYNFFTMHVPLCY